MKNIKIQKANPHDLDEIIFYIQKFKLDDENINYNQFQVAKIQNKIIGFGRIKPYKKLYELSSVGVIAEYRQQGIGRKLIVRLLEKFPTDEVWITTRIPEYFKQFGFLIFHTPPEEIELKQKTLCAKFSSDIKKTHCMLLKKIRAYELSINVS